MTEPVTLEIAGGVAALRFNRPDRMNAIDIEMAEALAYEVDRALSDEAVRVVTLSGEGRCFSAGGDLAAFRDSADRPALAHSIIAPLHEAIERLAAAPQITLAAIEGSVAGAGMSLAMGADLCLAAEGTTLNLAYLRLGVPGDCGATWALPRLVGLRKAMEIALLSGTMAAEEARALGLITRIVPAEALAQETAELAGRLARGPADAQGRMKRLLRQSLGTGLSDQLAAEETAFAECTGTADFAEGLEAFFARRAPAFGKD